MFTSPTNHQLVQSTMATLLAGAINEHCTPSLCEEVRQRSDTVCGVRGGGGGGGTNNMQKGVWRHMFALLISTNKCRKSHSSYLMLVNWKLPYVVFGVYYNTNLPLLLLVYCVAACTWMIRDCVFLEKILNIFIHASPNACKIQYDWHCVIRLGIRKKHAKRDLLWNLWAVSSLVNLPKKADRNAKHCIYSSREGVKLEQNCLQQFRLAFFMV